MKGERERKGGGRGKESQRREKDGNSLIHEAILSVGLPGAPVTVLPAVWCTQGGREVSETMGRRDGQADG